MLKSFLNKARAAARSRLSLLALLGLATLSTVAWQGCGDNSIPSASNAPTTESLETMVIQGYDTLPPEAQEKVDLVMGTLEDITSGRQDRVDAGFARLDEIEPGLYDEVMAGFALAAGSDAGVYTFELPIKVYNRTLAAEDPKYCTVIKVEFTLTIKKGSKICYEKTTAGGVVIEHCTTFDSDTVFRFNKEFKFECEAIEGCEIEHSSTSRTRVTAPIKYQGPDANGNGTPDIDIDITIVADLKVTVEVKTCN
ncbi:MAG: hypothetical protein IT349_11170 [Candidatus Eisenbacteria bacterium]|nr:hypothetical protein [Candidatus Eisenbacteria bacterium]